ncbi:hypothetical protein H5410_040593 [Solanum commersonii]|uniref:Uncharacterized protein n=1 Tax=Solanum commersonii TaxID=4109 RepID=A0A9J5XRC2_SOLCO|nr:hypothetical protein H5410_040593 [Solanum commersonii]
MTRIDEWWEDWYVDEILSLMRERHLRFHEYYDFMDRIMDLDFYTNFKKSTRVLAKRQQQLVTEA